MSAQPAPSTAAPHLQQAVPEHLQLPPQLVHPGAVPCGRLAQHPVGDTQPLRHPAQRQQQAHACRGMRWQREAGGLAG